VFPCSSLNPLPGSQGIYAELCEIGRGFYCLIGTERGWDVWVCAGQDGLIVQEEGAVVGGQGEVEDEGAGSVRCNLVALIPFTHILY
jgi:hypothetical protein